MWKGVGGLRVPSKAASEAATEVEEVEAEEEPRGEEETSSARMIKGAGRRRDRGECGGDVEGW